MQLTLTKMTFQYHTYWLGSTPQGLAFIGGQDAPADEWQRWFKTAIIDPTANQTAKAALTDYLAGRSTTFSLPLDQTYGTPFQQTVWHVLTTIPYGQTRTYADIANQLNRPTAVRAVATAIGRNPLLIIVPCHRIIRKDGGLGGYRGGLAMKQALLSLEQTSPK